MFHHFVISVVILAAVVLLFELLIFLSVHPELERNDTVHEKNGEYQQILDSFLKYISKICGLNFEIVAVTRPCIRFFSCIQIAFQRSDKVELDF